MTSQIEARTLYTLVGYAYRDGDLTLSGLPLSYMWAHSHHLTRQSAEDARQALVQRGRKLADHDKGYAALAAIQNLTSLNRVEYDIREAPLMLDASDTYTASLLKMGGE